MAAIPNPPGTADAETGPDRRMVPAVRKANRPHTWPHAPQSGPESEGFEFCRGRGFWKRCASTNRVEATRSGCKEDHEKLPGTMEETVYSK